MTTCSATTVPLSVTTSHSPLGRWLMSVTRTRRWIAAPFWRAPCAIALVLSAGATWPSVKVRNAASTSLVSRNGWYWAISSRPMTSHS